MQRACALKRTGSLERTRALQRAGALERTSALKRGSALLRACTLKRTSALKRSSPLLRACALQRTGTAQRITARRPCALHGTRALRHATRHGGATLLRACGLTWVGALQGTGALERIVALQRVVSRRAGILAALVLSLILLLRALLRLRNGGAARKDCESCNDTLRPKCNFNHETHLISGKDTGARSFFSLRKPTWLQPGSWLLDPILSVK